jgi:hypothetical protein
MIGRQFEVSFWHPPNCIVNEPSGLDFAVRLLNHAVWKLKWFGISGGFCCYVAQSVC